jgi:uncharacterized LabA/DUF88 family protein
VTRDERLRIAVFIDFDNIEIGVKNTLGGSFDVGLVLEALKERGEVVSKTAYSDWQRAGTYSRMLTQHAIKMVQRNLTPGGDKNGADINLALDALEMAFTHSHINAFVIVGGDSDFMSLVEKLKQYDKKVFIVGGRQFTSVIMQRNCHEFIAYENLVGAGGRGRQPGRDVRVERAPIEQAIPLVTRGLKVLSEREVSPQLGLLKSTLLQLDSTFSERSYGAGTFRDFVEKLAKLGVVSLAQGKGGLLVTAGTVSGLPVAENGAPAEEPDVTRATTDGAAPVFTPPQAEFAAPVATGSTAEGVEEFKRLLSSTQVRRWPMYLRNVKQVLRQASPAFDERAYGFGSLVDLLRAAQREALVRMERDRQGVIRVFQGAALVVVTPETSEVPAVAHSGNGAGPSDEPFVAEAGNAAPPHATAAAIPILHDTGEPEDDQVATGAVHVEQSLPVASKARRTRRAPAREPRATRPERPPRRAVASHSSRRSRS